MSRNIIVFKIKISPKTAIQVVYALKYLMPLAAEGCLEAASRLPVSTSFVPQRPRGLSRGAPWVLWASAAALRAQREEVGSADSAEGVMRAEADQLAGQLHHDSGPGKER
jgi:hypothetical protein